MRRVPPDLQEFLGNRRYITVLMPNNARESTDKRLIKAWNEATTQVEADIAAARAEQQAKSLGTQQVSALSPKDAAGLRLNLAKAAECRRSGADHHRYRTCWPGGADCASWAQAGKPGAMEQIEAAKAAITQRMVGETLEKLQIKPDSQAMRQIHKDCSDTSGCLGQTTRSEQQETSVRGISRRNHHRYPGHVTYAQLIDEWVRDAGGSVNLTALA